MNFSEFEETVREMVDDIPEEFLQGLQAVQALEQAHPEPDYVDIYRMGEYLDMGPEQFLGAGEGIGRHVVLYYGSFKAVAAGDSGFDWEEEIWETLTHELRHHVESLAGDASLILEDEAHAREFRKR